MKDLEFRLNSSSCCWCETYKIICLCKESGFASSCCLLCMDIFIVSVRVFTVAGSSWSASKVLDSYVECLGFWQCVAACCHGFVFG